MMYQWSYDADMSIYANNWCDFQITILYSSSKRKQAQCVDMAFCSIYYIL